MITEVIVLGVLDCDMLLMFPVYRRGVRSKVLLWNHKVLLLLVVWMIHPLLELILDLPLVLLADLPDPFKHLFSVSETLPSHLLLCDVRPRLDGEVFL